MTFEQILIFGILFASLVLFLWGRWRYDVVAVLALIAVVITGLVDPGDAFLGFAHPAVITVAAVLVISRALQNAGIVDVAVKAITPLRERENLQIAAQTVVVAVLSSFMNNVGALALMLPVALRNAHRGNYPPAKSLMALAFGSLLGGLTTLIGTPPNLIIAIYRQEQTGQAFGMFDYTPVGIVVAAAGVLFVVLIGWRLLPLEGRDGEREKPFEIDDYVTEVIVPEKSKADGATVYEIEDLAEDEVTILGIVRDQSKRLAPAGHQRIHAGDILIVRGDADALQSAMDDAGLKLAEERVAAEDLKSEDVEIVEAVISPGSRLIGRTPMTVRLRTFYGLNLLALSRQGRRMADRIGETEFASGDVLLLQGPKADMAETLATLQCLPLAERDHGIGRPRRLIQSAVIFGAAILLTMSGLLAVHVSFIAAAAAMVLTGIVKPNETYDAIDWPVIVLLAAMFPLGAALESTGAAALIAGWLLHSSDGPGVHLVLFVLLLVTILLTNVINNNATAILMAPIGMTLATRLDMSPDPFLMTIAIGASAAFLTPIGHQSNALVMEPAGYRFGDYWRLGLPLEVVVAVVAIPMILWVWPP